MCDARLSVHNDIRPCQRFDVVLLLGEYAGQFTCARTPSAPTARYNFLDGNIGSLQEFRGVTNVVCVEVRNYKSDVAARGDLTFHLLARPHPQSGIDHDVLALWRTKY